MERTTMMFVMIKRSCLRLFVLLLSLYLLSAQNVVNALTFKADGFSVTTTLTDQAGKTTNSIFGLTSSSLKLDKNGDTAININIEWGSF